MRILYDSKKSEYKSVFGALREDEKCTISIKIPISCKTETVCIAFENENTGEKHSLDMSLISEEDGYDIYSTDFSLETKGLYFYHFHIVTEGSEFNLFRYGYDDTNIEEGQRWQITCYEKDFSVSDSFKGKVMYQIFPDRFYHEEIENATDKLLPYHLHTSNCETPEYEMNEAGKVLNCDFFGGNLKGIIKKLDYIKSLGVSMIYLNPIFKAYSNHRYDTCDYKKIDPLLGDEKDFENLCTLAHKKGIKIILDGVFSHTGSNSIYFDKEGIFGGGAYSDPQSPYAHWYSFGKSRDDYTSWWGIDTLPCVNEMSQSFIDYIIQSPDSVVAHWMKKGADGFRLDVADELPDEFIKLLRNRIKSIKDDSFTLGEVWEDASNKISYGVRRKYFSFGELDSVMNYVFKNAIIDYVTQRTDGKAFEREVMTIAENYPVDCLLSLMNSLSTHDTSRILTRLSDADEAMTKKEKSTFKMDDSMRAKARDRLYIAALLQYVLPGTACIYYGDEIGMEGFGDPFCRGYFTWDEIDGGILSFFREMGKIKNSCLPLQKGGISFVSSEPVMIIEREFEGKKNVAVINMSQKEYEIESKAFLISHKISTRRDATYIQPGGFVLFGI